MARLPICALVWRQTQWEAVASRREARRCRLVSYFRYSGRSNVVLIAAIGASAVPSSPVLSRSGAQPPPAEKQRGSQNDPIKRRNQIVQHRRADLEPVDQTSRKQ